MKKIIEKLLKSKHLNMPILSFPSTQLIGCDVLEFVTNSDKQACGMKAIMDKCPMSVSLNMMDLSVEAEAFGATVQFEKHEIPTVTCGVLGNLSAVDNLAVPHVGTGRTSVYIDGIKQAKQSINAPIFCGVIGPYSLAGRLYDMTELMMACYDEPELVDKLLEKCTTFLIEYISAFKTVGANGVVMAEPAAGLLSPSLCEAFSSKYVKQIISKVNDDDFVFVYHNCGNTIPLLQGLSQIGADVYHFGNAVDIKEVLEGMPSDVVVMGNINPVNFRTESPKTVYNNTLALLNQCAKYPNFIISSGCDIPANSNWDAIMGYFDAIQTFYKGEKS